MRRNGAKGGKWRPRRRGLASSMARAFSGGYNPPRRPTYRSISHGDPCGGFCFISRGNFSTRGGSLWLGIRTVETGMSSALPSKELGSDFLCICFEFRKFPLGPEAPLTGCLTAVLVTHPRPPVYKNVFTIKCTKALCSLHGAQFEPDVRQLGATRPLSPRKKITCKKNIGRLINFSLTLRAKRML